MLNRLFRLLREVKSSPTPLLGRWCTADKSKNNWKVDMANTDHCGTCSYDPPKIKPSMKNNDNKVPKDNTSQ
jgi:hypothetical protein